MNEMLGGLVFFLPHFAFLGNLIELFLAAVAMY